MAGDQVIHTGRFLKDLTGRKFFQLTAIRCVGNTNSHEALWLCRCDCGNEKILAGYRLTRGNDKSCGCFRREIKKRRTHGMSGTPEFISWMSMIQRCRDKNHKSFMNYGGRGIKVCARWTGRNGFSNFLADMGSRPAGATVDRYPDGEGNYEPSNCRWATKKQQTDGRRNTIRITIDGKTQSLSDWCNYFGNVSYVTALQRLYRGIDPALAVSEPPNQGKRLTGLRPSSFFEIPLPPAS